MIGGRNDEFQAPGGLDGHRSPAAVGARDAAMERRAVALASLARHPMDFDHGAFERAIARDRRREAGHEAVERDLRFGDDADALRLDPGDEAENLAERAGMERHLAVVELAERDIGC